jgi:RNA polymerase sigma-70 factor (ECF subfamily)
MDAKRNMAKGPQPREGETRQMEGLNLERVIERARGQDAEALGEIYRRYVRRVFGLCRYMLDSRESAEDATSEVFLKLQRSIESYDGSIPFPKWLLRVTGNQCIDALRRRQRGRRVIVEVEDGVAVLEAACSEPSPLGAAISTEERAQVRDNIARLPENYRVPLVLRYYVAALIFRAKQELRRKLAHGSK